MSKTQSFLLSVYCIAHLALSGCAEPFDPGALPASSDPFGFGGGDPVELGSRRVSRERGPDPSDRIRVRGLRFDGELESPDEYLLDRAYTLEFSPLIEGPVSPESQVETHLLVDGKAILLDSSAPRSRDSNDLLGTARFDPVRDPVSIDLTPYMNQAVGLKFVMRSGNPSRRSAVIANLKLRAEQPAAKTRPHILFICSDTHRADHSIVGEGVRMMPRLQQWAQDAVVYPRAYGTASWTLPSITSALTGLYSRSHDTGRLIEKGPISEWDETRKLPPGQFESRWGQAYRVFQAYSHDVTSLMERLGAVGYDTAIVSASHFYFLSGLATDGTDLTHATGLVAGSKVNQAAFDVLDAYGDRPLFLLVHYMDVHEYRHWPKNAPSKTGAAKGGHNFLDRYRTSVGDADRYLGELLDRWEAKFGASNTLITYYSDHGEHHGEPGGANFARGFAHGTSMQEALLHIPMVVQYPAVEQPDSVERKTGQMTNAVTLADLGPTVLDVLGMSLDRELFDGRSLLAVEEEDSDRTVFADYQLYGAELSSARRGRFKLVFDLEKKTEHLIDLESPLTELGEPGQETEDNATRRQLAAAYRAYLKTAKLVSDTLHSHREIDQAEALQQLRSLGYVK